WIINNEGYYPDDRKDSLRIKIDNLIKKYTALSEDKKPKIDHVAKRTGELIAELEGIIDDVLMGKKDIVQPKTIIENFGKVNLSIIKTRFSAQLDSLSEEEFIGNDKALISAAIKVILSDI